MSFVLDPTTMFFSLVAATCAAILLLLWTYHLNRHERGLLWTALAFALGCIGVLSMAVRETLPPWAYLYVGVTALLAGTSMVWAAMRAFNGRPIRAWMILLGPAIWVCAGLVPGFAEDFPARMVLSSVIIAAGYAAAALELRSVDDGLKTRTIAVVVLAAQTLFVLLRIPVVLFDATPGMPSFVDSTWFSISSLESAVFVQVMSFLMISLTKERVEHKLRDAALTDVLTGLGNRRAYFAWTAAALARSGRTNQPLSIVLFDLDRFKEINDRFGHPVGDAVIQAFADAAKGRVRAGDFIARLGGEEFALALPDTAGEQAATIAREINAAFMSRVAKMAPGGIVGTASAGVVDTGRAKHSVDDMLTAADRALYEAKALGRGAVRLAPSWHGGDGDEVLSEPSPTVVALRAG